MNFEYALTALREGKRVHRRTWQRLHPDRSGAWLELAMPTLDGRPVEPELMMCFPGEGNIMRSFAGSSALLLADDWEILPDLPKGSGSLRLS